MLKSSLLAGPVESFTEKNFSGVDLGHKRREKALLRIVKHMALKPGDSVPKMMPDWSTTKSAYRLVNNESTTPESVQAEHRRRVHSEFEKAPEGSEFLLIEDTSEVDFSGRQVIEGLGPVGPSSKGRQGFHLHSTVTARVPEGGIAREEKDEAGHRPLELMGFAHQEYYVRKPRPEGEPKSRTYKSQQRERESNLFLRSTETIERPPAGVRFWRVVDRGGDVFLTLANYQIHGHDFVVRALHNRRLEEELPKLFDHARTLKPFDGEMMIHLRARPGRAARDAKVRISATRVKLAVPHLPRAAREQLSEPLAPIECTIVRVFEVNPPAPMKDKKKAATKMEQDREPAEQVEWFLLTSAPVESFEQAREVAARYSARWIIEEFHRALKEGIGAERIQFETAHSIFATIAIKSVIALRLVALKEHVRLRPEDPATEALSELEIQVLEHQTRRTIKTVREAMLAIGRLGGHLNRRSDGMPGYKTLMLGFNELNTLVKGVTMAKELKGKT